MEISNTSFFGGFTNIHTYIRIYYLDIDIYIYTNYIVSYINILCIYIYTGVHIYIYILYVYIMGMIWPEMEDRQQKISGSSHQECFITGLKP